MEEEGSMYPNINWNEIWKSSMEASDKMAGGQTCSAYFENSEVVEQYNHWAQNEGIFNFKDKLLIEISKIQDLEKLRVLDIGSGPGRHTLPLSKMVKDVTAVEPSKAMISCLKENLKKNDIRNVTCINEMWENLELGQNITDPFDIVISSFSLAYYDLRSALMKMNDASSGYVFLVYDTKSPVWEKIYMAAWPSLYGVDYLPKQNIDCVINVLWQMGIYPNILPYHHDELVEFQGVEQFLKSYMINIKLTTKEQKEVLNEYFNKKLVKKDGKVYFEMNTDYSIVWWKSKQLKA